MTGIGPVPETTGWKALMAWLEADGSRNVSELARRIGVKQPSARAWVKRFARPEGAKRDAVCALTGARPDDWETDAELQERQARIEHAKASGAEPKSLQEPGGAPASTAFPAPSAGNGPISGAA